MLFSVSNMEDNMKSSNNLKTTVLPLEAVASAHGSNTLIAQRTPKTPQFFSNASRPSRKVERSPAELGRILVRTSFERLACSIPRETDISAT
jgi:hypothetical protein